MTFLKGIQKRQEWQKANGRFLKIAIPVETLTTKGIKDRDGFKKITKRAGFLRLARELEIRIN